MLRFMARELKGSAIMIVATFREIEVRRSPNLSKMIGELSREARSIPVGGLSESEVTKLVEFKAGQTPDDKLVTKLYAATNGNPLFVDGIVRTLVAEGTIGSAGALDSRFKIPGGVRQAIRLRLDALSLESNSILAAAAAIGNEFDFDLCRSVADFPAAEAHCLLDEASNAGIVTELGDGRYQFSHALVRGAVYDELDTNSRILVHGKIANRMEEFYRKDIDAHLTELAHHFREAGVGEKAIDYSVRASRAAYAVLAYTDALKCLQTALGLMEKNGSDTRQRAKLLAWLGRAAFEIDRTLSLKYRESAIALYESIGDIDQAARIHLGLAFNYGTGGPLYNGTRALEHFRRAESVLAKGPETPSLALLYRGIAAEQSYRMDLVQAVPAARHAMEIAERIGDQASWSEAASEFGQILTKSGRLKQAFALFDQAYVAADQANIPIHGHVVAMNAGWCCRWLRDPRGARAWLERELNRPRNAHVPFTHQELSFASNQTYFDEGRVGEAYRRLGPEHWGVRFWVAGEWEAVAALEETAAEEFERTGFRVARFDRSIALGVAYLILGEHDRAGAHLQFGLDNGDRGPVVLQEMRARPLLVRVYVAMNRLDAAAEQVARCRQIMAACEDWRGLAGDVALAEAIVAAGRGNYDIAESQFESALTIHQKYHLAWDEADTLQYWGRALAAAGDRIRAARKFDAAIENHRSRGVGPRFLDWLMADKTRALGATPIQTEIRGASLPDSATTSKVTGTFRRDGKFWTINYDGISLRLKNAKGLHYVAYLLARPAQRIHVHDLIEALEGSAANGQVHAESEDLEIVREIGGPVPTLDARARSEYRARMRDLRAELAEAERMNDLGRSESLRNEIEMVGQELTGSLGLGGRARAAGGSAERARGLVGKNIRSVVEKIRDQHRALGRHFAVAISTGNFCAYQPEPDHPISWQL